MASSLQQLRKKALARPAVRKAYDDLADEFAFLDEVLKARAEAGLTQAEVARLESATSKHSPSIATLQRYARALGCRVEVRLVKQATRTQRPGAPGGKARCAARLATQSMMRKRIAQADFETPVLTNRYTRSLAGVRKVVRAVTTRLEIVGELAA